MSVNALTFEGLGLQSSFSARRYIVRISRSSSYIKVIGSRSRSQITVDALVVDVYGPLTAVSAPSVLHNGCIRVIDLASMDARDRTADKTAAVLVDRTLSPT